MGITGKRSSFVGLIPSFRLTVEALSKISGRASWLACSRQCLPGFADLSIEIPVAEKIEYDPFWRPKFESLSANPCPVIHPRSGASGLFARATKSIFSFRLPSPRRRGFYFFPFGRQIRSHAPQLFRKDRRVDSFPEAIGMVLGSRTRISGLLHRKEGWGIANTRNYLRLRATFSEE